MKKLITIVVRTLCAFVLFVLGVIIFNNLSPIYNFSEPKPFSGDYIYNPYADFDPSFGWKKANFHTHTKVDGIFNECDFTAEENMNFYSQYGYDIVTISNHNEITAICEGIHSVANPVEAYEHGYNLFNFHQLVFDSGRVNYFEYLTPFLASQKQYIIDRLTRNGDILVFNHIHRLRAFNPRQMTKLTGYNAVEAKNNFDDSASELAYWDIALSAGQYSGCMLNDDLHFPDNSARIARRATFLNVPNTGWEGIKRAFLADNYYSMVMPDFGDGDISQKVISNGNLPYIENIDLVQDTIVFDLSTEAVCVKAIGQNGVATVLEPRDGDVYIYKFKPSDTYIRLHADYGDAFELYTNPFVRTHDGATPPIARPHTLNIPLTIIWNLLILLLTLLVFRAGIKVLKRG